MCNNFSYYTCEICVIKNTRADPADRFEGGGKFWPMGPYLPPFSTLSTDLGHFVLKLLKFAGAPPQGGRGDASPIFESAGDNPPHFQENSGPNPLSFRFLVWVTL